MKSYLWILFLIGCLTTSCSRRVVYTQPTQKTVVITKAPRNSRIVVVKGRRYHYWGGRYYQKTRRGYVVVKI